MATQSRADAHRDISRKFVESWNDGIDADEPAFLRQFSPAISWHDHAFFTSYKGLPTIGLFRTKWLTAIANFRCDIKSISVVEGGTAIQCLYNGTMVGSIPGKKASGRSFAANVLILLAIGEDDKIQRVDEYYSATFDRGQDVESYRVMGQPERGRGKL